MDEVIREFVYGVKDSLDVFIDFKFYYLIYKNSHSIRSLLKCVYLLNFLIFFGVHFTCSWVALPLIRNYLVQDEFKLTILYIVYYFGWLVPFYILSIYFNSKLFLKLAIKLRPVDDQKTFSQKLSELIYDYALMYCLMPCIIAFTFVPYVGTYLSIIFTSWLNAYAIFNYRFVNDGVSVEDRNHTLEDCWSYFLGFGIPITLFCLIGNFFVSGVIFYVAFPIFMMSSIVCKDDQRMPARMAFRFRIFEYPRMISEKLLPYLQTNAFGAFIRNIFRSLLA